MHTKKEKHILLDKVDLSVYHEMKTNKKNPYHCDDQKLAVCHCKM